MAPSGSVPLLLLPLLLAPAGAVTTVYQQLADVTTGREPDQFYSGFPASAASGCVAYCDAYRHCTGFVFDGVMCTLYFIDCRGPVPYGDPVSADYMAKNTCPDTACACPEGYSRYGARCLQLLDQMELSWNTANELCFERGGRLAVPRSQPEQDQINLAAASARTKVWLGMNHNDTGEVVGIEGCGPMTAQFWAPGEPGYKGIGSVYHSPPALAGNTGWYTLEGFFVGTYHPLCQLDYCYRPDCLA